MKKALSSSNIAILIIVLLLSTFGVIAAIKFVHYMSLSEIEKDMLEGKFTGASDEVTTATPDSSVVPLYTVQMNTNTNNISLHRYSSPFIPAQSYKVHRFERTGSNNQILMAYIGSEWVASVTTTPPYHAKWRGVKQQSNGKRKKANSPK